MHKQRLFVVIALAIGILTSFMTFAAGMMWVEKDGGIAVLLFAVALVMCLLGDRSEAMPKGKAITCAVCCALAALIGIYDYSQANEAAAAANALSAAFGGGTAVDMTPIYGTFLGGLGGAVLPFVVK